MNEGDKGRRGVDIAKHWWPDLKETAQFSPEDICGVDAWLDGQPVQIKYDLRSANTGNVVHELYEKPPGRPDDPWRAVGQKAQWYIWANDQWAIKVSVNRLAIWEMDRPLRSTNNGRTSLGYILPVISLYPALGPLDVEYHWHGNWPLSKNS